MGSNKEVDCWGAMARIALGVDIGVWAHRWREAFDTRVLLLYRGLKLWKTKFLTLVP